MIAVPAVDLKGGRCVQLVGGRPEDERVSLPDPEAIARAWFEKGFCALHVVDLDAALGSGDNRDAITRVLGATDADTQVGGGVRSTEDVAWLLEAGADRVVVGTRAVKDPEWLEELAATHPNRIVVAADIRDGEVLVRGWTEGSGLRVLDLLERLGALSIAGILCTDVGREGRVEGIDREGVKEVVTGTDHRVWISGGVSTRDDLEFLGAVGAYGAVLGMALYTEALDAESIAAEFGAPAVVGAEKESGA